MAVFFSMNHRYSCWTCSSVHVMDGARYLYHCAPPNASKFHLFWVTNDRAFFLYKAVPCVLSSQQIFQARAYPEIKPFYQQTCHSSRLSLSLQSLMCQTLCRLVHVLTGTFLINKSMWTFTSRLSHSFLDPCATRTRRHIIISLVRHVSPSREQAPPSKTPYGSKMVSHIPEDINPQPS